MVRLDQTDRVAMANKKEGEEKQIRVEQQERKDEIQRRQEREKMKTR